MKTIVVALLALATFCRLQAQEDATLEVVGGLNGALLYNTYVAIGAIADASTENVYDSSYVVALMDEQKGLLKIAIENNKKLLASGVIKSETDIQYLKDLNQAYQLLKTEAEALIAYMQSKSADDGNKFDEARRQCWALIAKLLELE